MRDGRCLGRWRTPPYIGVREGVPHQWSACSFLLHPWMHQPPNHLRWTVGALPHMVNVRKVGGSEPTLDGAHLLVGPPTIEMIVGPTNLLEGSQVSGRLGQVAWPDWSVGRSTVGAPSPPLFSWWCPHLSCEVLSKVESSCTLACFHVGLRIHVLSVWTIAGKHSWIQGLGLTPWSMPRLMPRRGAPSGPKPRSADWGYGAHRAHFLLPCIEQAKSTSGTLLVINMFMWCLSSFNRGLLMGFWVYRTGSYFPSTLPYLDQEL